MYKAEHRKAKKIREKTERARERSSGEGRNRDEHSHVVCRRVSEAGCGQTIQPDRERERERQRERERERKREHSMTCQVKGSSQALVL